MLGYFCTSEWKNMIENGQYAGQTLDQVWNEHRELFGDFQVKISLYYVK